MKLQISIEAEVADKAEAEAIMQAVHDAFGKEAGLADKEGLRILGTTVDRLI